MSGELAHCVAVDRGRGNGQQEMPPRPGIRRPVIIQGGMGVGVSGWRLARAVGLAGQLGVVSGLGLDILLARRLQLGDPEGHLRRALTRFPFPAVAEQILDRYFVDGGIDREAPFCAMPRLRLRPSRHSSELAVAANFVEIFLAKEGHDGLVGINYLEKTQMATPAAVYGAMLAGVDYVLMGAGVPAEIPELLDAFAAGQPGGVTVTMHGAGAAAATSRVSLAPKAIFGVHAELSRPQFLAIVGSNMLATYLARETRTRPEGFVVEGLAAGGHSARPRGPLILDPQGQPTYGPRDVVDLEKLRTLGLPYWLAGGYASPQRLREAQQEGAAGVQVGSAFALCDESGLRPSIKRALRECAITGTLRVRADPLASPTGFPFKVAHMPGTLADERVYAERQRVCDLGYLRVPYRTVSGDVGYRCSAEPVRAHVRKGGQPEETTGRRCLCNGLAAAIGLGQRCPTGTVEPAIVTIGQELSFLPALTGPGRDGYSAREVVDYLVAGSEAMVTQT
jgi:NAD(P)H-dependent flavin oxidoreductase YrpB (nitropropane dioxygenase family)